MSKPNFKFESKYWKENKIVAGIDEAGRGCLAGPVCAASVILSKNSKLHPALNDSKRINEKLRDEIYDELINSDIIYSYCLIDNDEIDKINILQATYKAMNDSVGSLSLKPDVLLIDGNRSPGNNIFSECIVKGDQKSLSIAAASIIAKVTRDRFVKNEMHKKYPEYNFVKHKGYATKEHFELIQKFGISSVHRQSFLVKFKARQLSIF